MKVSVNINSINIIEQNTINKGEYQVHKVEFVFSDEYTDDLVKIALFTQDNKTYKMIINDDECNIPPEILENRLPFILGVYAYKVENEEMVIRYSPAPTEKYIICGSYIADEDTVNSEPITPSELEQFQQIIEDALSEVANVDIDATKVGHTATVTITNREGVSKSVEIQDGETGPAGADAKINGYNTIQIIAGALIRILQEGNILTIEGTFDEDIKNINDLTYYTLTTQTGSKIELEINSSTYMLTAKLYDKNNNLISTSTGIDLPLETMVVDGTYDAQTKSIILTLKNGNTITFSVADLVSGLQTEINAQNKLSADLVDDSNSTNKFVTESDKSNWNGKQNAIDSTHKLSADLVDDTSTTNKFVTSAEKTTWNNKLDTNKVKTSQDTTQGNVYDVTYINTMIGDIESIMHELNSGSGVE